MEPDQPLPEPVAAWLKSRKSPNTRAAYRIDITLWLDWLDRHGVDLLDAQQEHADEWREHMRRTPTRLGKPPTAATVARRLASVSSFYEYLCWRPPGSPWRLKQSPLARVERPEVSGEGKTPHLDEQEAERVLAAARAAGPRTHVAVQILLGTGLRAAELLGINLSDLTIEGGRLMLTVTRKGGKQQKLPLPDAVANDVDRLRGERATGRLFTGITGEGQWEYPDLLQAVEACGRAAGVDHLTPHMFRVTWTSVALAKDVPLDQVQDVMGHASPATTRRYDRGLRALERRTAAIDRVWAALTGTDTAGT